MPFILPFGQIIQIDYFNVHKGTTVVVEYLHDGVLLVVQTMPTETAMIYSAALASDDAGSHSTAQDEAMTFELKLIEPHVLISADSVTTKVDGSHMEIDYLLNGKVVLSQRTSVGTVRQIAEEI